MQIITAKPGTRLDLGRQGEAQARTISFDLTGFEACFPGGTPQLLVRRPTEDAPYLALTTENAHTALWTLSAADTAIGGFGACELQWRLGQVVAKSEVFETFVSPALTEPSAEPPEAAADWVASVLQAAETAHNACVHTPVIGENGNWFYWDAERGAYAIDSGFRAKGEAGPSGMPGNPGMNGDGIESFEKTASTGLTDTYTFTTTYGNRFDFTVKNGKDFDSLPVLQAVRQSDSAKRFHIRCENLSPQTGSLLAVVFDHPVGEAGANAVLHCANEAAVTAYLRLPDMSGQGKMAIPPADWFKAGMPYLFQFYDRRTAEKPNDIYLVCITSRAAAADLQGIVAVKNGGTGAATAAEARANLGIDAAIENAINALRQELGL